MTTVKRLAQRAVDMLMTPPVMNGTRLKTNLDTNFLKIIAVITMAIDHIGMVFFPDKPWFRYIGRLSFPIFCYCMTVGMLYTRSMKKYLLRLAALAVISQPVYLLALYPDWRSMETIPLNVFFTLLFSLGALYGVRRRQWWWTLIGLYLLILTDAMYSILGFLYMLVFYLCRAKPFIAGLAYVLVAAMGSLEITGSSPMVTLFGSVGFSPAVFTVFSGPLVCIPMKVTKKLPMIPKWVFYLFYPTHLAIIAGIRTVL